MRAVVTRVKEASVVIEGNVAGKIGQGFLILLGIGPEDTEAIADKTAGKPTTSYSWKARTRWRKKSVTAAFLKMKTER